jgi:hypothetical protein
MKQMSKKYERYQNYPFKGLPKCTKTGGFGLETNHLATLQYIRLGHVKSFNKIITFYYIALLSI